MGALQGWQRVHSILCHQLHIIPCRLEQENAQVQAILSAAKVENGQAKDQLAAVKAKLKVKEETPVLKINDHATGGRRTKDILGGPKGWGPKKKVANVEIYVIFEVFAFCGGRTKTDFKDRARV